MRNESKIAIVVVGVLVVVGGAWYLGSDSGDEQAADALPADQTGQDVASTPTDEREEDTGSAASPPFVSVDHTGKDVTFQPPPTKTPDYRNYTAGPDRVGLSDRAIGEGPAIGPSRPGSTIPGRSIGLAPGSTGADGNLPTATNRLTSTTRPAVATGFPSGERVAPKLLGEHGPAKLVAQTKTHVIQGGDTFCSLAARYLGGAKHAGLILAANPKMDPRRLHVGAKVKIPPAPAAASPLKDSGTTRTLASAPRPPSADLPPIPAERAYTVQPGESWYALAKRFLGEGTRWPELKEYNIDRIAGSSNTLRVGTVIELPPSASDRG